MKLSALEYLACPACRSGLRVDSHDSAEIVQGELACCGCDRRYVIRDGVPRFVESEHYTDTFGRQWSRWAKTQHDSLNGTHIYRERLERYTGWTTGSFSGRVVIDAGCGSGAYLDVVEGHAAVVIAFDRSTAIDSAYRLHGHRPNVHLLQADIFQPPIRFEVADRLYAFGVVQHTPDPEGAFRSLIPLVRPGGEVAVWVYRKRRIPQAPYLIRPFTSRLREPWATRFIEWYVPKALRLAGALGSTPAIGDVLRRVVPVADYRLRLPELSPDQQREWALMDTHDMLITRYTFPQRWGDLRRWTEGLDDVRRPSERDLSVVARVPSGGKR